MKYQSTNDEVRYYPTIGVEVKPDEVVDLDKEIEAVGLEKVTNKVATPTLTKSADASAEGVSE